MDDETLAYLILPFAAEYQYLQLASMSQTWRKVLKNKVQVANQLRKCSFSHVNRCPWEIHTCTYAAKSVHHIILQWAHQKMLLRIDRH